MNLIEDYPLVGMDTEFPGVVHKPTSYTNMSVFLCFRENNFLGPGILNY